MHSVPNALMDGLAIDHDHDFEFFNPIKTISYLGKSEWVNQSTAVPDPRNVDLRCDKTKKGVFEPIFCTLVIKCVNF